MLAWLAQQLAEWESGFSVFQYITLRHFVRHDRTYYIYSHWSQNDSLAT